MEYSMKSYNNGEEAILQEDFKNEWSELRALIESINEEELISVFESRIKKGNTEKSISKSLNYLFDKGLTAIEWIPKSFIFKSRKFRKTSWSLDFYKRNIGIEMAFHHEGAITWKLMKSVLANQPNEIRKKTEIKMGVFILVTDEMKAVGGFDSGIITFEKAEHYATVLSNILVCPTIFIGLEAPKSFHIKHIKDESKNRNIGKVIRRS